MDVPPRTLRVCSMRTCFSTFALLAGTLVTVDHRGVATELAAGQGTYQDLVRADQPVAYWSFNRGDSGGTTFRSLGLSETTSFVGRVEGTGVTQQGGPAAPEYPLFGRDNQAVALSGAKGFIRVTDAGERSPLDFYKGDSITLEAWVRPSSLADGQNVYVVGKGRTNQPGFARENQNYALRLRGQHGSARVSFLFRNRDNRPDVQNDFHRWTSDVGFVLDNRWHHLAVTFTFGEGQSLRGYLDGQQVTGTWDMGGASDKAPVVDDDELWIGSSLGGQASNTMDGLIDEVAIYRKALSSERIRLRYQANLPDPRDDELADEDLPTDEVLVEVHEGITSSKNWSFTTTRPTNHYLQATFAFVGTPKKYVDGLIADRTNPFLIRARTKRSLPAGQYRLVLQAKNAARFYIDGTLVAETQPMNSNADGHEAVPERAESTDEHLRRPPPGHQQRLVEFQLDDKQHVFRLDALVGGKALRAELGEVFVGMGRDQQPLALLGAAGTSEIMLDEQNWPAYARQLKVQLQVLDKRSRKETSDAVDQYWAFRHQLARDAVAAWPSADVPEVADGISVGNDIDRFIGRQLELLGIQPAPLTDDYSFLRRVTLDTVGVLPTRAEIAAFVLDRRPDRRAQAIDRLLTDPRWADHWTSYWQDVLAENPGILKPQLNNTGPFRWWIYESLLDNKPLDRFVTELIMMRGSKYGGGPAGFAMATQNDVPMAAKAQIVAKAFLGVEMKCARCHDAPYHPFTQENLFNLAAMLEKKAIALPETSTVGIVEGGRRPAVEMSLSPGDEIRPDWPFENLAEIELPEGVVRNTQDHREKLAALVTSPHNQRFAQVMVNRLWHRWMGRGLVDPVDDWEGREPSHPRLLIYLARQLVSHNYDLQHVARLILNSHTYQRQVRTLDERYTRSFAAQTRRRLTAEQLVDSLFAACDKPLNCEVLTLDPEGRRPIETFLNLGAPRRAWQFTSLSNERDRPALALPMAQSIVDVLQAYGWRDSRPNPITTRDETPTMLQQLAVANGIAGCRAATLSDDSGLTQLSLVDQPVEQLVEQLFLQILSRPPHNDERSVFVDLLADGYDDRRVWEAEQATRRRYDSVVSWSNHLSAEATKIKLELERLARAGDPPTNRLADDWRQRMEDAVWALFNSPEFVFVP